MFNNSKYTKWYFNIVNAAKKKNRIKLKPHNDNFIYYEKHHVVPKCLGGVETVLLTAKEHFICHLLLPKMCLQRKDYHRMKVALSAMCMNRYHQRYKITSILYEQIKIDNAIALSMYEKSIEHRRKISNSIKQLYANGFKSVNPMKNKKHSEETKEKMRMSRLEYCRVYSLKHTELTKQKIRQNHWSKRGYVSPMKNKKHSEETKEKIRKSRQKIYLCRRRTGGR